MFEYVSIFIILFLVLAGFVARLLIISSGMKLKEIIIYVIIGIILASLILGITSLI